MKRGQQYLSILCEGCIVNSKVLWNFSWWAPGLRILYMCMHVLAFVCTCVCMHVHTCRCFSCLPYPSTCSWCWWARQRPVILLPSFSPLRTEEVKRPRPYTGPSRQQQWQRWQFVFLHSSLIPTSYRESFKSMSILLYQNYQTYYFYINIIYIIK